MTLQLTLFAPVFALLHLIALSLWFALLGLTLPKLSPYLTPYLFWIITTPWLLLPLLTYLPSPTPSSFHPRRQLTISLIFFLWIPTALCLLPSCPIWLHAASLICGFLGLSYFLQRTTLAITFVAPCNRIYVLNSIWLSIVAATTLGYYFGLGHATSLAFTTASLLFSLGFLFFNLFSTDIEHDKSDKNSLNDWVNNSSLPRTFTNLFTSWLTMSWLIDAWSEHSGFLIAWTLGFIYAGIGYNTREYKSLNLHGSFPAYGLLLISLLGLGYPYSACDPSLTLGNLSLLFLVGFTQACIFLPSIIILLGHPQHRISTKLLIYSLMPITLVFGYLLPSQVHNFDTIFMGILGLCTLYHALNLPHDWFVSGFRFTLLVILKTCFNLRVIGKAHINQDKSPLVVVSNHVSFLDTPILGSVLNEKLVYPIFPWWMNVFYIKIANGLIADLFPTSTTSPSNMLAIVKAIKDGRKCLIFPEGRLTNSGNLMKIYQGSTLLVENAKARVQAVVTDGGSQSYLARPDYRSYRRIFPQMTAACGPVHTLETGDLRGKVKRHFITRQVFGLLTQAMLAAKPDSDLFTALELAKKLFGSKRLALRQTDWEQEATYQTLYQKAYAIQSRLAKFTEPDHIVGIWLPSNVYFCEALFACFARQAIAMPISIHTDFASWTKIMNTYAPRLIVTSPEYIEDDKLSEHRALLLQQGIQLVSILDLRKPLSLCARLSAQLFRQTYPQRLPAHIPALVLPNSDKSPAIFTHQNLLQQAYASGIVSDLLGSDTVFNQAGLHDTFGIIQGLLHPLLSAGVPVVLEDSVNQPSRTLETFYDLQTTILVTRPDFLEKSAPLAYSYDCLRMRAIFVGEDSLQPKLTTATRNQWESQGKAYVYTSFCPTQSGILTLNTPYYNDPSSLGQLLPGMSFTTTPESTFYHPLSSNHNIGEILGNQLPSWHYHLGHGPESKPYPPVQALEHTQISPLGYLYTHVSTQPDS